MALSKFPFFSLFSFETEFNRKTWYDLLGFNNFFKTIKDIQKYLPLYIPLFNMTSLLSFLKVGRQDIKMLNIFL